MRNIEGRSAGEKVIAFVGNAEPSIHLGELIGAGDSQLGVGLKDTRGCDPHIVVVGEGFLDEALQHVILVHGRPFHFGKLLTGRWLLGGSIRRNAAILAGHA